MLIQSEVQELAERMAKLTSYDEAWMTGLEIQSYGPQGVHAFHEVLQNGTLIARRAAAFWLSDEAEIVPPHIFLEMAEDSDSEIRFHAAYCLGYIKDENTVPTLRKLMFQDASEEVRQTAAQSLYAAGKLNGRLDAVLEDYQKALAQDQSAMVREEAVTSLANFLKSPNVHRAIALLEKALHDSSQLVREQAKISLSVLRNESWNDETLVRLK
ncbi:MAG: HEAT repeat domain-containing protein [Chloroflexi bacterium]|nr:HEAT repeat domain-containing protein [Chloroflexota bacterium]